MLALAPLSGVLAADHSTAIYDDDPGHLWNRLYRAIAVRTEAGIQYGADSPEPFDEEFDDPAQLQAVLDEFLRSGGENLVANDLKRALLLHDVWAAFDLAAHREIAPLQLGLARVLARLRLSERAIADTVDCRPLGSIAYSLALVAAGAAAATITFERENEWDVAAGAILIEEAGGTISDLHGRAFRFNQTVPTFEGTIAASSGARLTVQELLRQLQRPT